MVHSGDENHAFIGPVYTNTVSFVTVSCNRIVLYTGRPKPTYLPRTHVYTETICNRVLLKTLSKVERFQNDTVTSVV